MSKKNRKQDVQKEKEQKDKQRSTKHTYKAKDRVTLSPLKAGGELRCSGRVSSSCSTIKELQISNINTYVCLINHVSAEALATGVMIPPGTISPSICDW